MSSEINLLRNQFVKLQELVTSLKNKDSFVIRFVTNETIPQTSLNRNTVYVNNDTNQFIIYDDFNNDWKHYDIGGLSFDDLSSILVAGTNTTIVVDSIAQTITINSTGGGVQIQTDWNQTDNTEVDYIKNKPSEFPPSSHTHSDTQVNLTETYHGALEGAVTQKDVNDVVDNIDNIYPFILTYYFY